MNQPRKPRFIIAAPHSGAGKTTVTLGIMRALVDRGLIVQPFKVGPDYIDTGWHQRACHRESRNLDGYMLSSATLQYLFQRNMQAADVGVIEGVMGLYDGFGSDPMVASTASIAHDLHTPVILVVDGKAVSTSIAATVLGFQIFSPETPICGVIVNRVNSDSHYQLLKTAIETYCHLPVFGRLPSMEQVTLGSRHLGLVPGVELGESTDFWQHLTFAVEQHIALDDILRITSQPALKTSAPIDVELTQHLAGLKLGVAQDKAFHFYYADNLDLIRDLGVEICFFSPLRDSAIPAVDALYIGGGFPELFGAELSLNNTMRASILCAHEQHMPIYAECGGLMYLGKTLTDPAGTRHDMVGVFDGISQMRPRLQRFGYCEAIAEVDNLLLPKGESLKGHEFHHSDFTSHESTCFAMQKSRDTQLIKAWRGGYYKKNTLASYLHIHFYQNPQIVMRFLATARINQNPPRSRR